MSLFTLMFHGFLRIGEVTTSANNLLLAHVTLSKSHVIITFHKFKHHTGPPLTIRVQAASTFCPVASLMQYLTLRKKQPGPLFQAIDKKPLSPHYFTHVLNLCLSRLALDKTYFKPHSFRIGAATHAFASGVSVERIQQMGRWKSQAFKKYIRLNAVQPNIG